MSIISKFYDEYLEREDNKVRPEKEILVDFLQEFIDENEDLMKAEGMITEIEDKSSEEAFTAGFKTAMTLLMEVLA
jgi:hypothetical protein